MNATIVNDYLNTHGDTDNDTGVIFDLGSEGMSGRAQRRRFKAYDDDDVLYYEIVAELADDADLGNLLDQLAAFAGVTRLEDVTGDGDDWSAS